jgi:ferric-chelate reductase
LNLLNFTFVLFPIARNSIWTLIFGIPFERAIKYHKWISVWAYVCMCLHFIFICIYNGIRETPAYPWTDNYTAGLAGIYGPGNYGFVFAGFVSWIFFTIQILLTNIRRDWWNLFAYTHLILAVLGIVFASIHHYHTLIHLAPSIFLYFVDYVIRKIMFLIPAEVLSIKPMAGGITRLEIKSFLARFSKPGDYVFIYFPQASLIGRNPFSISTKTGKDSFTLHIKSMEGRNLWEGLPTFTNTMYKVAKKCEAGKSKPYFIRIEGPYGKPSIRMDKYKVLLLVSGGIGATPNISILQNLSNKIKDGKLEKMEKIYFVWSVRNVESLEWFREIFEEVRYEPKIELMLHVSDTRLIPEDRPVTELPILKGRPDYQEIIQNIQEFHPKVKYFGCSACGPLSMVSNVETLCWSNSFNSINRQWHFHKESFLL